MKTEWTVEEIAEVLAPIFEQQQFKWARREGMIIPTKEDIVESIYDRIEQIQKHKYYSASSGRIGVRRDEEDDFIVSLEFFLG